MRVARRRNWLAATAVLVTALGLVAFLHPTHTASRDVALHVVRPDGQPLPRADSGEHEVVLASGCGVERWPVKTGSDADRGKVSTSAITTTIASLRSRTKPSSYPNNNRIAPVELHTWLLTATVTQYKEEADSDIHLVIKDGSGRSMIAEIPSPSCVSSASLWRDKISGARTTWKSTYPLSTSWHYIHRSVRLRGLGFFDVLHGQTGVAPNGIELHPIIGVHLN